MNLLNIPNFHFLNKNLVLLNYTLLKGIFKNIDKMNQNEQNKKRIEGKKVFMKFHEM